jgi:copper chaperone
MKRSLLAIAAVVLGLALAGCPGKPPEYSAAQIVVNGLTCDMCVSKVEMAVKALEGVQMVSVSLKEKLASVQFEAGKLKLEDIEHAIAEAGFAANATPRNETAAGDLPSCCQQ